MVPERGGVLKVTVSEQDQDAISGPAMGGRQETPVAFADTSPNAPMKFRSHHRKESWRATPLKDTGKKRPWFTCTCLDWLAYAITEAGQRVGQRRRPKRIIMVRHGESVGNVDATAYGRIPDNRINLTEQGHAQAMAAGKALAGLIGEDESVLALVSPYQRTQETMAGIQMALGSRVKKVIHEPNLREQDFGNFQDPDEMDVSIKERKRFGRFFYRFPHGESGADVYARVESFMSSLFRHMDNPNRAIRDNIVIVSHGIVMRMFLMRFFRWTVEEYELIFNPDNCAIWMLQSNSYGEYSLVTTPQNPAISAPVAGVDGQHLGIDIRMSRCHNRTDSSFRDESDDESPLGGPISPSLLRAGNA